MEAGRTPLWRETDSGVTVLPVSFCPLPHRYEELAGQRPAARAAAMGRGAERNGEKLIILHIYLFSGIIIKYVENFW